MNIRYNYVMAIKPCMGMRDLGHEKPLGLKVYGMFWKWTINARKNGIEFEYANVQQLNIELILNFGC